MGKQEWHKALDKGKLQIPKRHAVFGSHTNNVQQTNDWGNFRQNYTGNRKYYVI